MTQSLVHVALLVNDYDEAIDFCTNKLDFELVEDTFIPERDKRWVLVAPPGAIGSSISGATTESMSREGYFSFESPWNKPTVLWEM